MEALRLLPRLRVSRYRRQSVYDYGNDQGKAAAACGVHRNLAIIPLRKDLSQAPLLLQDTDARFYRCFLRSLLRQVRHLRHIAGDMHRGATRLQAAIALCYAALCIAGQARHIRSATMGKPAR